MSDKVLTVVIPAYNEERFIGSLLEQVRLVNLSGVEVPVHYYPRSKAEGKKIGISDWFTAIRTYRRFSAKS